MSDYINVIYSFDRHPQVFLDIYYDDRLNDILNMPSDNGFVIQQKRFIWFLFDALLDSRPEKNLTKDEITDPPMTPKKLIKDLVKISCCFVSKEGDRLIPQWILDEKAKFYFSLKWNPWDEQVKKYHQLRMEYIFTILG